MRKLLLNALLCGITTLLCLNAYSQKKMVAGTVVDSAGTPVPNVTVRIKNGQGGTTTNENGVFKISAAPTDVLVFTNVGFGVQEIRVGNNAEFTVTMRSKNQELNEVVVTALGIRRSKNSLPYATQQISGSDINKTPTTNFVDNLSGKVAGLQITTSNTMGGSNNVILRGLKSLTQSNQALFVVDGVPYDNTNPSTTGATGGYDMGNAISDLNPNDIESMNVLKGAAASALYGSRGSNGVIIITTKKGSRNVRGIGVTVNFGVTSGIVDNSTMPTYQTQYGEGNGSGGSAQTGNPNPYFYWQPASFSNGQNIQIVQTDADQATGPAYDPSIMVYQWDAFAPGNPNFGKATPWKIAPNHKATDGYFVTPVTTTTSVTAEGGSDKGTFRLGYTRSQDKGYIPNSTLLKNLLTFGATYSLAPNLTASAQLNFTEEAATGRDGNGYSGGNGTQVNPMTDFRQWWQTGLDLHELKSDYFRSRQNITWNWDAKKAYLQNGPAGIIVPAFHDNPYWVRYTNPENDTRDRYVGYAMLNWKATSFLNFMGRVSRDYWTQQIESHYAIGSYGTPAYNRQNYVYGETNYDFTANFDKNLTDNLNLKALAGFNIRQDQYNTMTEATNGGLVVPNLYALSNSVNTPAAPTEYAYAKEVDGIYAGATLSWKEMVTLDGTIRRDKSSTLPLANNSYYYPMVSAAWTFSKMIPDANWVGKLRANYAQVGGDAPYFSLQNTFVAATPFNGQTIFTAPTTNNNATLKPETNHTYEVGGEGSFFNNRLGIDVTYYHAQQINEILPVTVSTASGYSKFYVNGGTIQNSGVELTLSGTPIKEHDFQWDVNINWSTNKSLVVNLYGGQPSFLVSSYQNAFQMVAEKGKSYGILRGSTYMYRKNDGTLDSLGVGKRLIDANGYPVLSPNKTSDIGDINPKWIGGINNTFHYKNFSFNFLIDWKQGGSVYSLDQDYGASGGLTTHTGGYNSNKGGVRAPLSQGGGYLFTGVTADGKDNTKLVDASDISAGKYPWSSLHNEAQRTFIYDASYVKLREVNITWSMPARILKGISFCRGIDLSLTGRNLWLIHKNLPDADPEQGVAVQGSYGQNGSQGFQSGAYPIFRTFGFNARVKF